ncbi:MAG: response regulator [Alphaproteobacteria bacterium]|nr:response regulator [Alphaproteobacteria bacterium]MCK5621825.1 response regulator [Alphaproteobacteria bacterium]
MSELKLLVVDDDRDFAEGLAELLELFGHWVDVAFTGEAGIDAANGCDYDAILMDISLPGLNGVESLQRIRQSRPDVPCFLMTGYSADEIARQGIEAGASEILTKPLDPESLEQRLATVGSDP